MTSSHLSLLTLICVLTSASFTGDTGFLQLSSDFDEDMLSRHMHRLYEKYNREKRLKEGNTIRSFRAIRVSPDHRIVYRLNLTTLQESEVILSATFHFLLDKHTLTRPWFCKRFKTSSCHTAFTQPSPSISLMFRSLSSGSEVRSEPVESSIGNVTFYPHRKGVWQMKDVTKIIKEAQDRGQFLLSLELEFGQQPHKEQGDVFSAVSMPYLLLYANDQALAEPNSVAASLQRYDPISEGAEVLHRSNSSPRLKGRIKRQTNPLPDTIQNNELPEVNYRPSEYRKEDVWEINRYLALKPKFKAERKEKMGKSQERAREERDKAEPQTLKGEERIAQIKTDDSTTLKDSPTLSLGNRQKNERSNQGKHKGRVNTQSSVLSFDEQTMRKARRRQWGHNRRCSRRNLRVDFADIGWNEWVIAPESFDAYYCAGACGFPMPQAARPSNHATIQSIVRAVGIIPGIPEPCCVPENMSPLAVLFQEESRNLVLKVYPNMSVQSCSCR
ncbi:growth/differentiation factor 10 isoform X1 [Poeciliopsis prolifica]|uniref:growth/differentiation factor 10 isoform X1 n=1 Tax=Poeciliopsis prolifica TaxID=188132 RepID=UPI0024134A0A|nr:growth/differentiation factor 10 isoform X1 [Poeciliopsis prolifica]